LSGRSSYSGRGMGTPQSMSRVIDRGFSSSMRFSEKRLMFGRQSVRGAIHDRSVVRRIGEGFRVDTAVVVDGGGGRGSRACAVDGCRNGELSGEAAQKGPAGWYAYEEPTETGCQARGLERLFPRLPQGYPQTAWQDFGEEVTVEVGRGSEADHLVELLPHQPQYQLGLGLATGNLDYDPVVHLGYPNVNA
jgi:hypothetical protein